MKTYTLETLVGTLLKSGQRSIGMGLGLPKARPLVLDFKKWQTALKTGQSEFANAEDALLLAEGEAELVAALTGETLDEVQLTLAAVVKKNYQDPLYRAAFPKGLTAYKDQTPQEMHAALPRLVQAMRAAGDDRLKKLVPAVEAHLAAFVKPLAALDAAELHAASAALALERAKVAWLDAYAALEGGLHAVFPRQKKFVARFFPKSSGPAGAKAPKETEDTDDAPTDAAAPAPAPRAAAPTPPAPGPVAAGTVGSAASVTAAREARPQLAEGLVPARAEAGGGDKKDGG